MTSVNFQQWIQHPETLNRDTLYELRNLLARYPYFQSLRLLYLKNLYILHDISFGGELRKAVLYIADRRQLFRLIEGDRYDVQARKKGVPLTEVLKDEPSVDRTLALIDAFLSTVPEEVTARTSFDYSMDYTSFLLEETPATEQPAEETPKLKGFELIDDFIEKSESDSPLCMKPLREEMPSSPTSSDELTTSTPLPPPSNGATHRQPAAICKWLPMKRLPTRTAVEPTSCCATTPTKASAC